MNSFTLSGYIIDSSLPPTETLIMLALARHVDDSGICWPSKETLARSARCSKRTADRYIDKLQNDGWFVVQKQGGRKSNVYKLCFDKIITEGTFQPCKSDTPEVQPMLHPRGATHAAPELSIELPENTADKKSAPRVEDKKQTAHSWFVSWWCFSFQQLIGSKYAMTAKDGKQVKQLLQQLQPGDLLLRACSYFALPDQKRFPRGSPTIGGLLAQINEVANTDDDTIDKFQMAGLLPKEDQKLSSFQPWR